ncbi:hypothetical protein QTP88_012136 [Uroleucon formosanum]
MNKFLLAVAFCIATTMTIVQAAPAQYTTKYDNVNIDEILNNDRLVNNYFKCLMETGKCTPEGEEIKHVGVKVLNAAFANTFQYMPPELMGTIAEMHGAINQAYQKEADQLSQNN